jgi:hypothetical protein
LLSILRYKREGDGFEDGHTLRNRGRERASKKGIEKDGIVCTERLIHNAEATTVS